MSTKQQTCESGCLCFQYTEENEENHRQIYDMIIENDNMEN